MARQVARRVRYHLRANIAPELPEAQAEALYEFVRDGGMDEVMFFAPHAEELSPGLGTDDECRAAVTRLRPMFEQLRRMNVAPSINIWWTMSFSNFGLARRTHDGVFDFRWAVSAAGRSDRATACPLDERWLAEARRVYAAFAALQPRAIWIDDDVNSRLRGEIQSACFCEVCLERFAGMAGQRLGREALVSTVLADPPNPVRDAWLQFQREILLRVVTGLREAVHAVSPGTRMGVMHSGMETHFAQGRRWSEHFAAVSGPHKALSRPTLGNYSQDYASVAINGMNATRFSQAVAGPTDDLLPEIENYGHTGFNKSLKLNAAHMTLCQLLGLPEVTLSIFRFSGRLDLDRTRRAWGRMLSRLKPRLQSIADLGIARDQHQGVGLFWHEEVARVARDCRGPEPFGPLTRRRPWDELLGCMGIATRYGTSDVTAFSGEAVACLGKAEREAVFSRGVLLDARAAATMIALGDGELAGLSGVLEPADAVLEVIEVAAFGRPAGNPINLRTEGGRAAQFSLLEGAKIVSTVRSYGMKPSGHGMTLFANRLGGRVAVLPFDGQLAGGLHPPKTPAPAPVFSPSWGRQAQLRDVLAWLGKAPLDLFVPDAPNAFVLLAAQPTRLIAAVANFGSDRMEEVRLEMRAPRFLPTQVRELQSNGAWRVCQAGIGRGSTGALQLDTDAALDHLDVGVFEIS